MLDYRIETFITLCKERNYSKTAQILCITQPAVTQHIQYLERHYNCKLFEYENKQLNLTPQGKILERMALGLHASTQRVHELLQVSKNSSKLFRMGASLTTSEYMLYPIIAKLTQLEPSLNIAIKVNSSELLLKGLKTGAIECAIIEGDFDKTELEHYLFSREEYIFVSSKPVEKRTFNDLLNERLLCEDTESGSYKLLTQQLSNEGLSIHDFVNVLYANNLTFTKQLAKTGAGIAFISKLAVEKELANGELYQVPFDHSIYQEYHFVIIKNNMFLNDYVMFYDFAKPIYEAYRSEKQ